MAVTVVTGGYTEIDELITALGASALDASSPTGSLVLTTNNASHLDNNKAASKLRLDGNNLDETRGGGKDFASAVSFASSLRRVFIVHFRVQARIDNLGLADYSTTTGYIIALLSGGSTTTDYSAWCIGGKDSMPTPDAYQAAVIDPNAVDSASGALEASVGTFDETDVTRFEIFVTPAGTATRNHLFAKAGYIDPYVLAGGTEGTATESKILDVYNAATADLILPIVRQGEQTFLFKCNLTIGDGSTVTYVRDDNIVIEFARVDTVNGTDRTSITNETGIELDLTATCEVYFLNAFFTCMFQWHADFNSSGGATVDFQSCTFKKPSSNWGGVVGSDCTFRSCTFTEAYEWDIEGATFEDCRFENTPSNKDSLIVIDANCTFTRCIFDSARATSKSIIINAAGTYTFDSCTFLTANNDFIFNHGVGEAIVELLNHTGDLPTHNYGGLGSVTIRNIKTLSLTTLQAGSEVRVYTAGTQTELNGVESSGTSFNYNYNYSADFDVDIVIYATGYLYIRIEGFTLSDADNTIPIGQQIDRWYENP